MPQKSATPIRDDGLQIEEHRRFQERFWTAERIGWMGFGLILLVALSGLTGGGGPLSRGELQLNGATIDFPRIARWESSDEMQVRFGPGTDEHRLTLTNSFLKAFQIERIEPQPDKAVSTREGTTYSFLSDPAAGAFINIHLKPVSPGYARYGVLIDEARSDASAMILP